MKIHAVNVIKPLSEDRREKVKVGVYLVLASSAGEALRKVAGQIPSYNHDYKLVYRNEWDEDEPVLWTYQTWERKEYPTDAPTVSDILGE